MMYTRVVRWIGTALTVGAITFTGSMPSYAQVAASSAAQSSAAYAVPSEGVPNTTFIFRAVGFQGAIGSDDDDDNADARGERVSYWINTPDGSVIDTREVDETDNGGTTEPLEGRADGDGEVEVRWTAPNDIATGAYSVVLYGQTSNYQVVIPFTIAPAGSQAVVQTNVSPSTGSANTLFTFRASGFIGGVDDDDDSGEDASYWINTPDGTIIATKPLDEETDHGNTSEPLVATADGDGQVKIFWTAPADAAPGAYSLVVQGLSSQHQVVIPFTIR